MSQWEWTIAAVIAVITLVQIVVFYYFIRGDREELPWPFSGSESQTGSPPGQVGAPDGDRDPNHNHNHNHTNDERFDARERLHGDEDVTRCSQCGTPNRNDSMFTFCRNCGGEL